MSDIEPKHRQANRNRLVLISGEADRRERPANSTPTTRRRGGGCFFRPAGTACDLQSVRSASCGGGMARLRAGLHHFEGGVFDFPAVVRNATLPH